MQGFLFDDAGLFQLFKTDRQDGIFHNKTVIFVFCDILREALQQNRTICLIVCLLFFDLFDIGKINIFDDHFLSAKNFILSEIGQLSYDSACFFLHFPQSRFLSIFDWFDFAAGEFTAPVLMICQQPLILVTSDHPYMLWFF